MVNLTRIYTKTGADGTPNLGDFSRTTKTDPRLVAYADVDEANSAIGLVLALGSLPAEIAALLTRARHDLFAAGADLCTPVVPNPEREPLRVEDSYIERLERAWDEAQERLAQWRCLLLPGGTTRG